MSNEQRIPLSRPFIDDAEVDALRDCLARGQLSGDGHFTRLCEHVIEERYQARRALLTTSCTSALELSAHLLELGEGDEVIMPSFTFVSTANAFVLRGAKIVFADIDPQTFNIDPVSAEASISTNTRALVPVHYAGIACDMESLMRLAERQDIAVVEDAAQGVHARWRDRWLGTIGTFGTYSFHDTKNFTSGEGGALLINDVRHADRAEILREKGTNRRQFLLGNVDKYTWVDLGSSYIPSELCAAVLHAQLAKVERITSLRKTAHERYDEMLEEAERAGRLRRPILPSYATSNYHLYAVLMSNGAERNALMSFLNERGISATFHYIPLHTAPMARQLGIQKQSLPVTEDVASRILRLPLYAGITEQQQQRIVDLIAEFLRQPVTAD
jgi:dTDP-4-amino-4,6-dideoxygalactose transaminase